MPCLALVLESGVTNMTLKRTISGMIGTGSLAHNRREFIAENVDSDRVQLNICYQNENLKEVYKELFDEAVERYNIGKRKDRQITNYYEKIRQGKQEKLFHEVIFQIGNREDMAVGTAEGGQAVKVLDEYVKDFQKRNPTLNAWHSRWNSWGHCCRECLPIPYKRKQQCPASEKKQSNVLGMSISTSVLMETLHKAHLTALHAICVQIFRHITQKSLAIHTVCLRNFCAICRKI